MTAHAKKDEKAKASDKDAPVTLDSLKAHVERLEKENKDLRSRVTVEVPPGGSAVDRAEAYNANVTGFSTQRTTGGGVIEDVEVAVKTFEVEAKGEAAPQPSLKIKTPYDESEAIRIAALCHNCDPTRFQWRARRAQDDKQEPMNERGSGPVEDDEDAAKKANKE